jgi:hypothetical protein
MGALYRPGKDCAKINEFKNPRPAPEAKKPAAQECGLLLERKNFLGERRYVNLGYMPSNILGPALEPGVSALHLQ